MANEPTSVPESPLLSLLKSVRSFAKRNPSPLPLEEHAQLPGPIVPNLRPETKVGCETEPQDEDYKEGLLQHDMHLGPPTVEYQTPHGSFYDGEGVEMETCVSSEQEEAGCYSPNRGSGETPHPTTPTLCQGRCRLPPAPPDLLTGDLGDEDAPWLGPRVISLLTDSEDSNNGNDDDDDELMITNVTPIQHKRSHPSSPFTTSSCSYTSSSDTEYSDIEITHMNSLSSYHSPAPSKRRRRNPVFRTGPWSYTDRMLLVEGLQRGVDFITLGMKMRRDVDDVFEKFSDVVAAGLYKSQTRDSGTQTEREVGGRRV